jgi:hypothetical protein
MQVPKEAPWNNFLHLRLSLSGHSSNDTVFSTDHGESRVITVILPLFSFSCVSFLIAAMRLLQISHTPFK